MTGPVAATATVPVRLLQFPLDVQARATEHFEGLKREFALLSMRRPDSAEIPSRLLALVAALTEQYAGLTDEVNRERDEAFQRGERVIAELVYDVPPAVAAACIDLSGILDEADEYCRQGQLLLTLATPPELVAYRRWLLEQFVDQADGAAPVSWSDYRERTPAQ